jgi:hypothetical protein
MAIRGPGATERPAADREASSLPLSDRTGLPPDSLKPDVLTPELLKPELFKFGSPQPVADTRPTPAPTGIAQPDEPTQQDESSDGSSLSGQALSGQALSGPSDSIPADQPGAALAFAVRVTPPDSAPAAESGAAATNVPEISSGPQASPQASQKQTLTPDAVASSTQTPGEKSEGEKGEMDGPGDPLAKTSVTPLPTQFMNQSASQSEPAISVRSEVRPALAPSPARVEPVPEPPAAPPGSPRDFTVRIPDATDRGTNVRFVERGSEVHVSVRTGDAELAQMLRGGLSDLTGRLQHNGIQAEVWRPGADSSQSDSQNQTHSQNQDPKGSGGRRNQSGAQREGQDQPSENKPRWVEELETSISEPAAHAGS